MTDNSDGSRRFLKLYSQLIDPKPRDRFNWLKSAADYIALRTVLKYNTELIKLEAAFHYDKGMHFAEFFTCHCRESLYKHSSNVFNYI